MAVAAGVCFALALLCLLVFIFAGSVPQLSGLSGALRGLGGDLRFVLPLAFVWFGISFAGAARGKRLGVLRALADVLIVLLFYAALHMFWADYVNENGYHVQAALGYGDFLKKSYDFGVGGGALGALLGGFAYLQLGKWLGFFALLLLLLGCLALNGYLAGGCALSASAWRTAASPGRRRSAAAARRMPTGILNSTAARCCARRR